MKTVEKAIEVTQPVNVVYNQWTQFEDFPKFMKSVVQLNDKTLHWKAEVGGRTEEWDAEIFEQIPDQRIAWRSMTGAKNSGMVNFYSLGDNRTRITVNLNYDPQGAVEQLGGALGVVQSRIAGDLKRFKDFIESRVEPTGGWRGEIHGRRVNTGKSDRGGPLAE